MRNYKYLDLLMASFVAVLIISNIASTKILTLWKFTFDGGTLLFPLVYIFGDVLTEVYGYKKARRVIWVGFFWSLVMALVLMAVIALPPASDWPFQEAFKNILGMTPRIVIASLVAYTVGEFSNSFLLAKIKIKMKGRLLWVRTISSTIVGEGLDTLIFVTIAFYGLFPIWAIILSNYIFKTLVEVVFTPLTYLVVNFLKKHENEDFYDKDTDFNPFSFSE